MEKDTFQLGVASARPEGESETGDHYLVRKRGDRLVVAVVDGLGHGAEAANAAHTAIEAIDNSASHSVIELVRQCHSALQRTRGVVISLAAIHPSEATLTWIGVGNVDGILVRADASMPPSRESIVQRGGVVGFRLPYLQASVVSIDTGDMLIMATDGIDWRFHESIDSTLESQELADRICQRFHRKDDDGLVLVLRYCGNAS